MQTQKRIYNMDNIKNQPSYKKALKEHKSANQEVKRICKCPCCETLHKVYIFYTGRAKYPPRLFIKRLGSKKKEEINSNIAFTQKRIKENEQLIKILRIRKKPPRCLICSSNEIILKESLQQG